MSVKRLFLSMGFGACCVHVIAQYLGSPTMSVGPSMEPTLNRSGDLVLAETISTRRGKLQCGDIVVARSPRNPKVLVCKRIIGMEGDRVCTNPTMHPHRFRTVPRNHVWLQGDNLRNSTDSRVYGPVPIQMVLSRVFMRIWPPSQAQFLQREFHGVAETDDALPADLPQVTVREGPWLSGEMKQKVEATTTEQRARRLLKRSQPVVLHSSVCDDCCPCADECCGASVVSSQVTSTSTVTSTVTSPSL
eukprot:m.156510 g.156510  ORF g.156510 m.156510 type:complete len:247 (-) comp14323_c1_seq5:4678-5418(-)